MSKTHVAIEGIEGDDASHRPCLCVDPDDGLLVAGHPDGFSGRYDIAWITIDGDRVGDAAGRKVDSRHAVIVSTGHPDSIVGRGET